LFCFSGAGKTTLIKLLTGQIRPTGGAVVLGGDAEGRGESADEVVRKLRRMCGVVLQSNTIWETLTVAEHLEFSLRLRGFSADRANIVAAAELVGLGEKQATRASLLSGGEKKGEKHFLLKISKGQKRKLCIGMALCNARAKLIMLDEPTSSLVKVFLLSVVLLFVIVVCKDPASALEIMAILKRLLARDADLMMVLTTHEMSEASALANEVYILKAGKVRMNGTVEELAEREGMGYTLIFKKREFEEAGAVLRRFNLAARESSDNDNKSDVVVVDVPRLDEELFVALERARISFRLNASTLTELFLKVCDE
jgi:ABC-type multidrug transport system ATPase subunit